jgi:hypothetical protein
MQGCRESINSNFFVIENGRFHTPNITNSRAIALYFFLSIKPSDLTNFENVKLRVIVFSPQDAPIDGKFFV